MISRRKIIDSRRASERELSSSPPPIAWSAKQLLVQQQQDSRRKPISKLHARPQQVRCRPKLSEDDDYVLDEPDDDDEGATFGHDYEQSRPHRDDYFEAECLNSAAECDADYFGPRFKLWPEVEPAELAKCNKLPLKTRESNSNSNEDQDEMQQVARHKMQAPADHLHFDPYSIYGDEHEEEDVWFSEDRLFKVSSVLPL